MMTPERDPRTNPQPGDVLSQGEEILTIEKREIAKSSIGLIRVGTDYIAYRPQSWPGAMFYMSIRQLQKNRKVTKVIHRKDS